MPVDRFELIVLFHKKKNSFGRVGEPISVKAKDGTGLIYARDLEFDPGRVYSVTVRNLENWRYRFFFNFYFLSFSLFTLVTVINRVQ